MRLPNPWRNGWGRKRDRPERQAPALTSHSLEDCSEEEVSPQRERIGLYENRCDDRTTEQDVACAIEIEDEYPTDSRDEQTEDLQTDDTRGTGRDVEDGDVQDGRVSDVCPELSSEASPEIEVRPLHEPMVRGESALEDDRPHREWGQREPRQADVRQPKQRDWYLSEPISVERWESTPHLRSGFSLA